MHSKEVGDSPHKAGVKAVFEDFPVMDIGIKKKKVFFHLHRVKPMFLNRQELL